mmetsp:Transcript_8987/g.26932  ORF Transcript_8987/g.26932 Transcript_8987/m.26932 type:complete len:219 (+) Transcript_8987:87-743(+)
MAWRSVGQYPITLVRHGPYYAEPLGLPADPARLAPTQYSLCLEENASEAQLHVYGEHATRDIRSLDLGCWPHQNIVDLHVVTRAQHPHHRLCDVLRLQALHGVVEFLSPRLVTEAAGLVEFRFHDARRNAAHPQRSLPRPRLLTEALSESSEGVFGGRVEAPAPRPVRHAVPRHRADVDDVPEGAAPLHVLDGLTGAHADAQHIGGHHFHPAGCAAIP